MIGSTCLQTGLRRQKAHIRDRGRTALVPPKERQVVDARLASMVVSLTNRELSRGRCGAKGLDDGFSQCQRQELSGGCRSPDASVVGVARGNWADRHQIRLRYRAM